MLMRHFTLAMAIIAGTQLATAQPKAVGSSSYAPRQVSMPDAAQQAPHLRPVSPLKAKQRIPSVIYCPQTLNKYYSEGEGFAAEPADETTYEYDNQGRVVTETYHSASALPTDDNAYVRYIYEYDEYGNIASMEMLQGKTISKLANQYKMVYTYDDVVNDYLVSAIYYKWMKVTSSYSKKVLASSSEIFITRDEQGRVTEWKSVEYDSNNKEIVKNRIIPTYDETTGLPSEVLYEEIYTTSSGAYDLKENQKFTNIVWNKCDCQFLEPYADLKQGSNLIYSADYYFCGDYWGQETVTYTDKEGEYYYEMPWKSGKGRDFCTWAYTDENGSYKREKIEWADKNANGVIDDGDDLTHGWDGQYEVYASTIIVTYNEQGDMVENLFEQNYYGEKNWMTAEKCEYVYDEELGGVMTQKDSYGGAWTKGPDGMPEYHPNSRLVWSNFIDITPSSISSSTAADSRSFTLSGGAVHFGQAGNNVYAVYDAQGRLVMSGNAVGAKTVSFDRLSSGMYVIAVKEADGVKTVKFSK